MKKIVSSILILTVIALAPGCALFNKQATVVDKAAQVQSLCYAAASVGTEIAMQEKPDLKTQFDLAYTQLDVFVTNKTITGQLLRDVLSNLPVKELKSPDARIAIEAATTLYDATVGTQLNIENQPYVVAAATGIRDGLKAALGK